MFSAGWQQMAFVSAATIDGLPASFTIASAKALPVVPCELVSRELAYFSAARLEYVQPWGAQLRGSWHTPCDSTGSLEH
jgi:hypothetical protein